MSFMEQFIVGVVTGALMVSEAKIAEGLLKALALLLIN